MYDKNNRIGLQKWQNNVSETANESKLKTLQKDRDRRGEIAVAFLPL